MKKIIFSILLALVAMIPAQAQVSDLSESDIQAFKDRAGEVIDMFQNNLSILAGKKYSVKVKEA